MNFRCDCLSKGLIGIDVIFFLGTIFFEIAIVFVDPGFINNNNINKRQRYINIPTRNQEN